MLKKFRSFIFTLGAICLFVPLLVFAEPPPAGVNDVVMEMGKFETSVRAEQWDDAAASLQTMEAKIKDVFMAAQRDDFVLEEAIMELQKQVAANDKAKVVEAYVPVQKQYFNYVSHFDHEIHPILVKIEDNVTKRAPSAYEAKDYEAMLEEMQTASMLMTHGKAVFAKRGIPEQEINAYASKVQALGFAVKANDTAKIDEIYIILQKTYTGFMETYK